ncbi:MAG: DUF2652 domain-containing protein [Myxococcaceae bacterium]
MAIEPAVLLIADIGGYTRFMQITRANLAHSQVIIAELLEAIIDAASPMLELAKLEGDAAFFYYPLKKGMPSPEQVEQLIARMRDAFRMKLNQRAVDKACSCEGCMKVTDLTLKFVAHSGDVAFQKVKSYTELAGVDVIIVHRMLKNDVPLREYVLMTEPLVPAAPPSLKTMLQPLIHDFEGIGETKTFYSDLAALPHAPPMPKRRGFVMRWLHHLVFLFQTAPYELGLKRPAEHFTDSPRLPAGTAQQQAS